MNRRFHLPGDHDAARELLKRATALQINVFREERGCSVRFKLTGYVSSEADDADTLRPAADEKGMEFVRDLLEEFDGGRR